MNCSPKKTNTLADLARFRVRISVGYMVAAADARTFYTSKYDTDGKFA